MATLTQKITQNFFNLLVVILIATLLYFTVFSDGLGKAPKISVKIGDDRLLDLSYPKKPVLVNFWATSCTGCIAEMPMLADMHKRLEGRFHLVAVSMSYDPSNQVKNFINKNPYPFDFVMDTDGKIANAFGKVLLTPTSFLIAPNGNIRYRKVGEVDIEILEKLIKQMSPQLKQS